MTDSCATPGLHTVEQALEQILQQLPKASGYQYLTLKHALSRVLYQDVISTINVPSFRNSSMDGYAIRFADKPNTTFNIIGTSWAGRPFTKNIGENECVRIFTGAYVPDNADCVVMQENIQRIENTITIDKWPKQFENIRNIADDLKAGEVILSQGTQLKASDLGLLASTGIANISVFKSLTIGFFSTGDELISIGSQPQLGQIFDSNRYTLYALLKELGAQPVDFGVIPDTPQAVENALLSASENCDVIITSGGASVGEADYITSVLAKIGQVNLWKIAMKPGKPLIFGHINQRPFFGLPGNPVSVMVNFLQIVRPALLKMMGSQQEPPLLLQATTNTQIIKQPGRKEFQCAIVQNINGQLFVKPTIGQGSHILSSISQANCLMVLEQESGNIDKGQTVNIQLLGKSI